MCSRNDTRRFKKTLRGYTNLLGKVGIVIEARNNYLQDKYKYKYLYVLCI